MSKKSIDDKNKKSLDKLDVLEQSKNVEILNDLHTFHLNKLLGLVTSE